MKKVFVGAALAALAVVVSACSSGSDDPFGAEPDYGAVRAHFDHPDGTIGSGNLSDVMARSSGSGDANVGGVFGGGSSSSSSSNSGGITSKSLHFLSNDTAFHCSALEAGQQSGSCACPSGGSFSYEIDGQSSGSGQSRSSDATMKFSIDACASGDTVVSGKEFLHISTSSQSGTVDYSMLFVVNATIVKAGVTHTLDLEEEYANGKVDLAIHVDDGWVVVSASGSAGNGTLTIRDRNGTWTCSSQNGAGTCTSDSGKSFDWHG
jgi:hypothetical protein